MIEKFDYLYKPALENRLLRIYIPDDYYYSDEYYPVIYMLDGQNSFEDNEATFGRSWRFKDFLSTWNKKIIIVSLTSPKFG